MASRIPKMFAGAAKTTIAEEVVAPSSTKALINVDMASAPTSTLRKGIPCAPKLSSPPSSSSSASAVPLKPSSMARFLVTRLPAPPVRNEGDDAAVLQPSKLPTTPQSSCSITPAWVKDKSHPQSDPLLAAQRQPCVPGGDDGLSAHAESGAELSRISSSSCASGFSSPLSAASSASLSSAASLSSSASLTAITTAATSTSISDCPSCPGTPGALLSAASSFVERPAAVGSTNSSSSSSKQGEGRKEPYAAVDTSSPPSRCAPATTTSSSSSSSSSSSRCSASVDDWPAPTSVTSISKITEALRLINELYEIYNLDGLRQVQRLSHALATLNAGASPSKAPLAELAPAPVPLASVAESEAETEAEDAPTPASPRASPSEFEGGAEEMPDAAVVVPAEEVVPAKPSGGLKRKLGKVLRGLFGSCVGRDAGTL